MKFKDFCELALSNDIIGIVNDITRDDPTETKTAYKWLLSDADELEKQVTRFTYGNTTLYNDGHTILFVLLK